MYFLFGNFFKESDLGEGLLLLVNCYWSLLKFVLDRFVKEWYGGIFLIEILVVVNYYLFNGKEGVYFFEV